MSGFLEVGSYKLMRPSAEEPCISKGAYSCVHVLCLSKSTDTFVKSKSAYSAHLLENTQKNFNAISERITSVVKYKFTLSHHTTESLMSSRSLNIDNQIALLKGAMFEIMQIRLNMVFNAERVVWECGPRSYCVDDAVRGQRT